RLVGLLLVNGVDAAVPARVVSLEQGLGRRASLRHDLAERIEIDSLVLAAGIALAAGAQARAGDFHNFFREVEERPAAERRREAAARHLRAEILAFFVGPVFDELATGIERRAVIEEPNPERRQRAKPAPRPAVGAAHLDDALEPHLGEGG